MTDAVFAAWALVGLAFCYTGQVLNRKLADLKRAQRSMGNP